MLCLFYIKKLCSQNNTPANFNHHLQLPFHFQLTSQVALGVTLLIAATLTTPAQGMQNNIVYRTSSDGTSLVECTQCSQQQYYSPPVATAPLLTPTYQRYIKQPSLIYNPPYVGQSRVVNIEPSPAGGVRYATTTYYTDYYNVGASGDHGSTCTRCDEVAGNGGVNGRVVTNSVYSSDSATYGGNYDDSKYSQILWLW